MSCRQLLIPRPPTRHFHSSKPNPIQDACRLSTEGAHNGASAGARHLTAKDRVLVHLQMPVTWRQKVRTIASANARHLATKGAHFGALANTCHLATKCRPFHGRQSNVAATVPTNHAQITPNQTHNNYSQDQASFSWKNMFYRPRSCGIICSEHRADFYVSPL